MRDHWDIHALPPGVYFLVLDNGKRRWFARFVKAP
jgi:hypothetical protein